VYTKRRLALRDYGERINSPEENAARTTGKQKRGYRKASSAVEERA
jgi:hypothetical protein